MEITIPVSRSISVIADTDLEETVLQIKLKADPPFEIRTFENTLHITARTKAQTDILIHTLQALIEAKQQSDDHLLGKTTDAAAILGIKS